MRKDYKCPTCSKVTLLAECSYKEAVRLKRQCKSCAMKKWQNKKYGNKKTTEFTSTCPNCGVEKKHKWKNISPTQAKTLTETMSKKLCRSCSNSIHYVLSPKKSNTKPERKLKTILNKLKIKYKQSYKFEGYYFDFFLPEYNILVEVDGNYWHGKGLEWGDLNETQKNSRKNDLKKNQICLDSQQKLIRLWEDEVIESILLDKIK